MPPRFADIVAPDHTAVLTMETQRAVIGDLASMGDLAAVMEAQGTLGNLRRLLDGARGHGAQVVHCVVEKRPDLRGYATNAKMLSFGTKNQHLDIGQPGTEVVPELGVVDSDVIVSRIHGMTPFTSTSLDQILRNMGITTVVATGVSVNIGVMGLVLSAVDLGYQVVVPTDAVAGIPAEYAEAVLANTFAFLTTLTTVDDILEVWG